MKLIGQIESAEKQYKQILEEFFTGVFDDKSLYSHGINHHKRVWGYAKELLQLTDHQNVSSLTSLPSKLIIACYLHDIGMSVEQGLIHGKYSKKICSRFLIQNKLKLDDFKDVLEAIENHDIKDYSSNNEVNEILKILSIADDLDAFGFTGIFRYSEIYLKRGINYYDIGNLIRTNAGKRFDNFLKNSQPNNKFTLKHKKRFEILDNFFSEYNKQVSSYHFGASQPYGYCGVIEMFFFIITNGIELENFVNHTEKYSYDPVTEWFFKGLITEFTEWI